MRKMGPASLPPEGLRALTDAAAAQYVPDEAGNYPRLAAIADALGVNQAAARRLLITAGALHNERIDEIARLAQEGLSNGQIADAMGLTKSAVLTSMPYQLPEGQLLPPAASHGEVLERLRRDHTPDALWDAIIAFEGETFCTAKGLHFSYALRGNEMFVDRKDKSITRATIELAYQTALRLGPQATGPKKLGCFGASYLYPIFIRLGVIPLAGEMTFLTKEEDL